MKSFETELESELTGLSGRLSQFELQLLLSEPYDRNDAILELHPGAGGTESQDWGSAVTADVYKMGREEKALRWKPLIICQVMRRGLRA